MTIPTRIAIGVGRNQFIALVGPDRLAIQIEDGFNLTRIDLGQGTKRRISEIQEYLERLKIHVPD